MAAAPKPTRLSYGAVAAGIGGAVLLISLFLPWYSYSGYYSSGSQSGWESAKFIDIVLLVISGVAIGFAVLELMRRQVRLPFGLPRGLQVAGIVATTITVTAIIEASNQSFGLFLATLAALSILAGGVFAERAPNRTVAFGGGAPGGAAPGGYAQGGAAPGGYAQAPGGQAVPGGQATAAQPAYAQPAAAHQPAYAQPAPAATASPPPAPPAEPAPPAGGKADWYPDPRGEKRLRYFDGSQWTQHVAD
jgi:hypothetical protein